MEFLKDLFLLLGRVLISATFLWSAYEKIRNWGSSMAYMKSKNIPQLSIVAPVGVTLKVVGALLIFVGWHAHIGALLLLIVTVPFTIWVHPFWKLHGDELKIERAFFMKEVGIIGGLLLLIALGAGHFGLGGGG